MQTITTKMRFLTLLIGLSFLSACTDAVIKKTVAGINFCVPKQNLTQLSSSYLIPTDLPEGEGFAFRFLLNEPLDLEMKFIPMKDSQGRGLPLSGFVDLKEQYENWARNLPGRHGYDRLKRAAENSKISLPNEIEAVYLAEDKNEWDVLGISNGQHEIIASCRNTMFSNGRVEASCRRFFVFSNLSVMYRFSHADIKSVASYDSYIQKKLSNWRC